MKKNKTVISLIFKVLAIVVLLNILDIKCASAQAPYCSATHSANCATTSTFIGAIKIQNGSLIIFNKPNDGCNQAAAPNYTLVSTAASYTMFGGSTYTMSFTTGNTNAARIALWIDLNGDLDFADAGEYLSTGWADLAASGAFQARSFTLPCTGITPGNTRLRIRTSNAGGGPGWNANSACIAATSGETEDYTIALALPTSLAAGFTLPTSAYKDAIVKMTNNNQLGYSWHMWDIDDDGSVEYSTTNASHVFTTAGTKCIRLKSKNCLGRDSVLKCINIIAQTAKPVVDFKSDTSLIEIYGTANFFDLSTNGPTYWSWYCYDPADSIATRMEVENYNTNLVGNNPYVNSYPSVFFNKIGNYTVCLQTSNNKGPSALLCKKNYLRVRTPIDNILGAGTVKPLTELSGCIIDDGGRTQNYSNNRIDYATIIPAGTNRITLKFNQFKVQVGDTLKIYDGIDKTGIPIHSSKGYTLTNKPVGSAIASSGAMYLHFSTNTIGVDSGIIACWTAETTGIRELDEDKTQIFPNPSTGIITINSDLLMNGAIDIQVYNFTGQLTKELLGCFSQNGIYTLNLSNEAEGLYTLLMKVNGKQITRKISIRR